MQALADLVINESYCKLLQVKEKIWVGGWEDGIFY